MQEIEYQEVPVVPATFHQLGVLVLDGSQSMLSPVDSSSGEHQLTKADTVNIAVRELITRLQASRKVQNFSMAFVNFHASVSHASAISTVSAIDGNADFDPTSHGTGGTFVGGGLEAAGAICQAFLGQKDDSLPKQVVVLVLSDGECADPERTVAIGGRLKEEDRIMVAAAYFGTKGASGSAGPDLLRRVCSDPVRMYKTVYTGEALRDFFLASMTAAALQVGGTAGTLQ